MGFLQGRVTWERFEVGGKAVPLSQTHVDALERYSIDERVGASSDGTTVGFVGGEHVLDLQFSREKNLVNDALHAAVRVDAVKIPGDLKKAWLEMEIAERAAENPSGFPTRKQKQEAKEAVEERIQQEAENGHFKTMRYFPFLWDSRQEIVYLGSASESVVERFVPMFEEAFSRPLTRLSAGGVGLEKAKAKKLQRSFEDIAPAAFFGAANKSYSVSWLGDGGASRDFLGNEFLLWLWWNVEGESDSIRLADDSSVAVMMSRTLSLECPLAETGKETISHESPIRLPEAKHAVRLGKLPRKSGLTLNRHDEQYDLTLTAETLGVSGAALPKLDSDTFAEQRQDRVDQIRHLTETIDLLFGAFVDRRLSSNWPADLKKLRAWLKEEAE
jgi:hypothetical protein